MTTTEDCIIYRRNKLDHAIGILNRLNNKVIFTIEDMDTYIGFKCTTKAGESRLARYEYKAFYDEYLTPIKAWDSVITAAELIISGTTLNDPESYHNRLVYSENEP